MIINIAGGRTQEEFLSLWNLAEKYSLDHLTALEQNAIYKSGGIIFYLTSGRK